MQGLSSKLRSSTQDPRISVVVPTRNRPQALARCLDALAYQTALSELEVIVVDDGSASPGAVAEVVGRHPFARLIRQDPSGPARARNAGAAAARGQLVCFTDDDCEPSAGWAETLAGTIEAGADAAAGTSVSARRNAVSAASELITEAAASPVLQSSEALSFAPSSNLACRTDVLSELPFDERYAAAAGEDRDWCSRLLAAGYTLRAEAAAVVTHRPDESFGAFVRRQIRYGRGAYRFHVSQTAGKIQSPLFYARLIFRGFARGGRVGLLVCLAQVATGVGFVAEWRALRTTTPAKDMASDPRWNRRDADQMVDDMKG
jgi:glycosyltransferase involved in cell wall biosynthesis